MFPGRLIDFGENSAVKHKSVLKCFLSRKELLSQSLVSVGNTTNHFMGNGKVTTIYNPSEQCTDGSATQKRRKLALDEHSPGIYQRVYENSTPTKSRDCRRRNLLYTFQEGNEANSWRSEEDSDLDDGWITEMSPTQKSNGRVSVSPAEKSNINGFLTSTPMRTTKSKERHSVSSASKCGQDILSPHSYAEGVSIPQSMFKIDRRQKAKFHEKKYRLPSHIDMALDLKLNAGSALSFSDYGTLCRGLYRSIAEITDSPTPENVTFVIKKMLAKYPAISITTKESDTNSTLRLLKEKLSRIFSRQRANSGNQLTSGGRPSKPKSVGVPVPGKGIPHKATLGKKFVQGQCGANAFSMQESEIYQY